MHPNVHGLIGMTLYRQRMMSKKLWKKHLKRPSVMHMMSQGRAEYCIMYYTVLRAWPLMQAAWWDGD
eukprot:scaffold93889_cov15-Prasinocladus_malaysianus.AAC.1